MSRTKTRPRVFSHASLRPPVRRHCSGKNVPRVRSTPSTPGGIPRVSAAGGPLRVSPDKMRKPPPSNPVLYPAPGCALRALSSAEVAKLIFWEKCGFIGVHEGLCLEHEGTTIDAAGVRVPPAPAWNSRRRWRKLLLRACGIVRFRAKMDSAVVSGRIVFQKIPLVPFSRPR